MNGQSLVVVIEKVVPGGYGLARVDGRVLLVRGAIPGERVRVVVEKAGKGGVRFGRVTDVLEASSDRVPTTGDPRCGGLALAHVRYERQLQLKADMLGDALRRTARLPDAPAVDVTPSARAGWRMRVRLHVAEDRLGFYREGSHELCQPEPSQCPAPLFEAARATYDWLAPPVREDVAEISVSEDLAGARRAVLVGTHRTTGGGTWTGTPPDGVVGVAVAPHGRPSRDVAGDPVLSAPLHDLSVVTAPDGSRLRWHPATFFQANRVILPSLVARVLAALDDRPVVDLFAGVGLFGVAAAASGAKDVMCVEGEPTSASWLARNVRDLRRAAGARLEARQASVEAALEHALVEIDGRVVIVDPPRTGLPPAVSARLAQARDSRIVYVSCDAPTFARDLRRFREAGWRLTALHAFDMFPHTAHLETLAVLDADR